MRRFRTIIPLVWLLVISQIGCTTATDRATPQPSVNLLAMGDWGSNKPAQTLVAKALVQFVQQSNQKYSGMLLAGDNFYVKLTGTDDPLWGTMFEQMYDPAILDFPFYAALGNHDYQDGKAEIEQAYTYENPQSRWKMPAKFYRVDLPAGKPLVTVLMLDSNRQAMKDPEWDAQTDWIKTELAKPRESKWVVCCAHHPLYSNGDHGDNGVLQNAWGPIFAQYHVDLFVAGHEHDLQHLEMENVSTSLILVGGGGQSIRAMRVDARGPFSKSSYGFAAMNFTPEALTVKLISKDGETLHEFRRTPNVRVDVTKTTPSDVATPRTPKSISRGGEETSATTKPATQPASKSKED